MIGPVPFEDPRYAASEIERCGVELATFQQPLTVISIVACLTVFWRRIRNKEQRRFPDNIFTVCVVNLCGLHTAVLISIATQNRVFLVDEQPWRGLCRLQASLFHWSATAAMWSIVCVMLLLHRVIVRKVPVAELTHYSRAYYLTLLVLPSCAVLACSLTFGYGPFAGASTCWIKPGMGRLIFFHSFSLTTVCAFLVLGPPTVRALWRARRAAPQANNARRLFRSLLLRQILLAMYGILIVLTFLLGGLNNVFLPSHPHSAYIKRSAYPLCIMSAVHFASLGLFVSIIYWTTKQQADAVTAVIRKVQTSMCCSCLPSHTEESESIDLDPHDAGHNHQHIKKTKARPTHAQTELRLYTEELSPRSPRIGPQSMRSAFDSSGQSAVSIPPDPIQRHAHQVATHAYTMTLLQYAREQLQDELDDDSMSDASYYSSEADNDSRRSMDELISQTDSSYPSSPHATSFRTLVPRYLDDEGSRRSIPILERESGLTEL